MSISYRTYVGPYAHCFFHIKSMESRNRACGNTRCRLFGRFQLAMFCSACGHGIKELLYTREEPDIDERDIAEIITGRLTRPLGGGYEEWKHNHGIHLYLPNITFARREMWLEPEAAFCLFDLSIREIEAETLAFQITFEDDLTILIERYGASNVSIRWGIVQDYN